MWEKEQEQLTLKNNLNLVIKSQLKDKYLEKVEEKKRSERYKEEERKDHELWIKAERDRERKELEKALGIKKDREQQVKQLKEMKQKVLEEEREQNRKYIEMINRQEEMDAIKEENTLMETKRATLEFLKKNSIYEEEKKNQKNIEKENDKKLIETTLILEDRKEKLKQEAVIKIILIKRLKEECKK